LVNFVLTFQIVSRQSDRSSPYTYSDFTGQGNRDLPCFDFDGAEWQGFVLLWFYMAEWQGFALLWFYGVEWQGFALAQEKAMYCLSWRSCVAQTRASRGQARQ